MRLLDRYVFAEWLKAFALAVLAMLGVLILEDIQDDLEDYLNWGAGAMEVLEYYAFLIPSFLPLIIPIGLLISILFTLGNLHRNSEITAMRASGLHLFTITRSLWLVGGLLALLLLGLNASIVPYSVEQSRLIRSNWRMNYESEIFGPRMVGIVPLMSFDNQHDRRLWFMNKFSEYSYDGFGVTVYERDDRGQEVRRIMGEEAYFDDVDSHWVFVNGRELRFDSDSGETYYSHGFENRSYPELTEDPWLMQALNAEPEDLSFDEIQRLLTMTSSDHPRRLTYQVREQRILSQPLSCLVMVGIAVPFAVAGVRVNPVVGVAKSLGFFVFFFALEEVCRVLGAQAVIPLSVAVWVPFGFMLILSCWFFRKVV
ncbi:MAG: LptF/LptG family permease [Verrucomicrobiota bacterium]